MLNIIIGLLLIATFIGLVVYVMKGGDIMIGFLVMTILWIIIGGKFRSTKPQMKLLPIQR